MTSRTERVVVDFQTARQRLQEVEHDREDPVYWDDGYWWEKAFNELITYEQECVQRLMEAIDAIPSHDDKATLYSQKLHRTLIESIKEHSRFRQGLGRTLAQWDATETISDSARYRLIDHIAYINEHIFSQYIQLKQVRLEQLERRRRHTSNIDPNKWSQSWNELQAVWNEQEQFYTETYQIAVPEHIVARHLVWLERMYVIQQETLQLWQAYRNINTTQLQRDMRIVATSIKELRPKEHNSWLSRMIAGLIGTMVCVILLYSLWGSIAPAASPLQDQVAVPIATSSPVGP